MAFYINLAHRVDRREEVEKELEKVNIAKFERFEAIMHENGRIGCSQSHLAILEKAKEEKLPYVMIVEDDIQFVDPVKFKRHYEYFLKSGEEWDVLLFGGNVLPPIKGGPYAVQVSHAQTTVGYMVKEHYYDRLIENIREGIYLLTQLPSRHADFSIDKHWISLQKKDKWFVIYPFMVVQRPSYSDIEQRETDYRWLMRDLTKRVGR